MRTSSLSLLIAATVVAGCQEQESSAGNTSADQPAQPAAEAADPATGLDSEGKTYPLLAGQEQQGTEASSQGSGEMQELESTQAEMDSLLALQPLERLSPSVILGTDDRKKVTNTTTYPERAQVLIALPGGRCSGAMIGKDLVLTAGHCVFNSGKWASTATVYPGKNGSHSPYGSCTARKFYSVVGWVKNGDPNYDFGAIKLNCDVGNRTGWLGFWWQAASMMNTESRISSYPGDKPLEQWTHTDKVRRESALKTYYNTDTMPGNSGSAVFARKSDCNPCAHTAHAYGSTSGNSGTRITKGLFDNLVRWKAE